VALRFDQVVQRPATPPAQDAELRAHLFSRALMPLPSPDHIADRIVRSIVVFVTSRLRLAVIGHDHAGGKVRLQPVHSAVSGGIFEGAVAIRACCFRQAGSNRLQSMFISTALPVTVFLLFFVLCIITVAARRG